VLFAIAARLAIEDEVFEVIPRRELGLVWRCRIGRRPPPDHAGGRTFDVKVTRVAAPNAGPAVATAIGTRDGQNGPFFDRNCDSSSRRVRKRGAYPSRYARRPLSFVRHWFRSLLAPTHCPPAVLQLAYTVVPLKLMAQQLERKPPAADTRGTAARARDRVLMAFILTRRGSSGVLQWKWRQCVHLAVESWSPRVVVERERNPAIFLYFTQSAPYHCTHLIAIGQSSRLSERSEIHCGRATVS
jgi:hypothetical protein